MGSNPNSGRSPVSVYRADKSQKLRRHSMRFMMSAPIIEERFTRDVIR